MLDFFFGMPPLEKNKFVKSSKSNNNDLNTSFSLDSDLITLQSNSDLDRLAKAREAIRWEKIGLLEDNFVQSVCRENETAH